MSTEIRESSSGGRDSVESLPPHPYAPQFYPPANYQGQQAQQPNFPGQVPPGAFGPWPPAPWGFPGAPVPGWSPPGSGGKISPHNASTTAPSDEYTVDSMRRIYNDDDGRVEIQRVKVQRRQPETAGIIFPPSTEAMSVVPAGTFPLNERRPPPRKNKMKRQMQVMQAYQNQQGPYPWYPYMPCMPYPYPYPYYYGGCMWPPGVPSPPPPMTPWPGSDESERTTSRVESLPGTIDSQRLDSRASDPLRNSHSPMLPRSPSPAATTHSIAPSDSVSVVSYKDGDFLRNMLRSPTPPPRTKGRVRAIMASSDISSEAGSTCTDLVPYQKIPPRKKNRKCKDIGLSDRSSSIEQKDTDSLSDRSSDVSEIISEDSPKQNSELSYAFRKFEQSVDVFKTKVSVDSTPVNTPPRSRSPSPIIMHSNRATTSTKDSLKTHPSETSTTGEETDTYVEKSDQLDEQPSTTSFSSLPLLETAPLEPLSSSTSTKLESSALQDFAEVCDTKSEQATEKLSSNDTETNINVLVSANDAPSGTKTTTDEIRVTGDITNTLSVTVQDNTRTSSDSGVVHVPILQDVLDINQGGSSGPTIEQKTQSVSLTNDTNEMNFKVPVSKLEVSEMELDASSGRESRLSSSTFFSIRPSDDPLHIDTDSTDILLPTTDATTADEGGEATDWTASSPVMDETESFQWVLQQPGEIPDLACSVADREDERRNAWRAEVSLWRARLVVSLCRGKGLDRQDWATFHLLVHHPLTLDLKLSMLHASRLCIANSTIGAALVRVALIHLAQYGETLLQPEGSRQLGWRSIKVDPNQSWSPVKGAVEILKALGYQEREDGVLRYPRRAGTEVSVLARLTLDMLVLAEELRLYLTGTHQYPTNISDLFFQNNASSIPASTDSSQIMQELPRPPSSAGSYSFMSAQSITSINNRPDSRASTVTDEDTETLQVSVKQVQSTAKKSKLPSSSEEEVTLVEDLASRIPSALDTSISAQDHKGQAEDKTKYINPEISSINQEKEKTELSLLQQSMTSLDMSSLPDLQSIRSSTVSLINPPLKEKDFNGSTTPISTPVPEEEEESKDNPEEHIYEEIDVIRQQVQALRSSSVPVDIQPPPLPPKKKISSGGEDDSGLSLTYPHMEWTSSSMPGSLPGSLRGGSTGARKKKRRAPMPPDFMPKDWKPYENKSQEFDSEHTREKNERKNLSGSKRSLNPFYEDIDSVKEQVKELNKAYENRRKRRTPKTGGDMNPFESDDYVASGYIGKNPFYEDIEEDVEIDKYKNVSRSSTSTPIVGDPTKCAMGSLSELRDDSISIKAKRKAPKPPTTPSSLERATPQPRKDHSSSQPPKSPSSPPPPPPPNHPPSVPPPNSPLPKNSSSSPETPKSPFSPPPPPPKSPSSPPPPPPKSPSSPPPPPPKISSSSQVSKDPTLPSVDHSSTTSQTHERINLKETQRENDKSQELPDKVVQCSTTGSVTLINMSLSEVSDEDSTGKILDTVDDNRLEGSDENSKARNVVLKAIGISQPRSQVQHPSIPPPPPPPKLDDEEGEEKVLSSVTHEKAQSLLDDIPYMDAYDVKCEIKKLTQSESIKSSQYEIPELPGKEGIPPAPPLSPTVMKQTAMLLSGQRVVPFIDDSDLPPNCPPPPPPISPPETPHTSPPETPHVSPPETPPRSPPDTPHSSRTSSPITIKEDFMSKAEPMTENHKSNNSSAIEKINEDTSTTNLTPKTLINKECESSNQVIAQAPVTETEVSVATIEVSHKDDPPPLPPKTLSSQNQSNGVHPLPTSPSDIYANQSIKSSTSERYEIPETPVLSNETLDEDTESKLEDIKEDVQIEILTQEPPIEEAAEERYEIPEVVKETALSIGPEGMPVRVGGPAQVNRMDLESVFGPPKPPRRRRNNSLPPPRPPKSMILEGSIAPKLPPKSATTVRPASVTTTSSFVTASAGCPSPLSATPTSLQAATPSLPRTPSQSGTPTSLQGTPKASHNSKRRSDKTRRSWPLLFCDCMYVNDAKE